MPRQIVDPAGNVHEFPDDMPPDQIHAEMLQRWGKAITPPATPTGPQPPGTSPSGLTANPSAPPANMPPLGPEAERAKRMIAVGGTRTPGDRAMVMAGQHLLENDPTTIYQKREAQRLADTAGDRAKRQDAGVQIIPQVEELRKMIQNYSDKYPEAYKLATGAYNTQVQPASNEVYTLGAYRAPDMTPTKARASYGIGWGIGNDPNSALNQQAWMIQNEMGHLIGALSEQTAASAGPTVAGSDARMQLFKDMIAKVPEAPTVEAQLKILHTAENALRGVFRMPHKIENEDELEALMIPPDANHVDFIDPKGVLRRKSRVPVQGPQ